MNVKFIIGLIIFVVLGGFVAYNWKTIKTLTKVGAAGYAAYILAGGTLAGYQLWKAYKNAGGAIPETATIEAEAAAGATEVNTAGTAVTAAGEAVTVDAAGAATIGTEAIAAESIIPEAVTGIGAEIISFFEAVPEIALLAL